MTDDLEKAKDAISNWRLGQTSEHYETGSRGAGTISTGRGDRGGVSYGSYQLSSKMGTLTEYLDQSRYQDEFNGLQVATPEFNAKWRDLARTDPEFAKDQHDFIKRTHFDVQNEKLNALGIDLSGRGKAVQDALWSTSVQYRNLTPGIFAKGLEEKFGRDFELAEITDKDIVEAVQDYKIAHNNTLFSKSPRLWPGLLERARNERTDLVQLSTYEQVLKIGGRQESQTHGRIEDSQPQSQLPVATDTLLHQDIHGAEVRDIQAKLNQLGYRDAHGSPLINDGDFGQRTREAIQAFQKAQGLQPDGIVGPRTLDALRKAGETPLLSSPIHPEHALYKQALAGIEQLPSGSFKSNEERQNAAASLTFDARISGLHRIDHVVLSANGSSLFAVQGRMDDPAHRRVHVDREQAAAQSIQRSTQQMDQERQSPVQFDQHQQSDRQNQLREPRIMMA